jgi:hypothetical protein
VVEVVEEEVVVEEEGIDVETESFKYEKNVM